MPVRVAINGFGRIGRNVLRAAKRDSADIDFVAINDLTDADTLAHLYRDVTESHGNDRNMTQAIYEKMVKSHGYASIEEAEKSAKSQATGK